MWHNTITISTANWGVSNAIKIQDGIYNSLELFCTYYSLLHLSLSKTENIKRLWEDVQDLMESEGISEAVHFASILLSLFDFVIKMAQDLHVIRI